MLTQALPENLTIPGWRYRQTHRQSVLAILGEHTPKSIVSHGTTFYNRDRWTARAFLSQACLWLRNEKGSLDLATVNGWVAYANALSVPDPEIGIAETPDTLPVRVAQALTGGAYHEAWHTLYSCRRDLTLEEISPLLHILNQLPNRKSVGAILQSTTSVIEDIRIERCGVSQFPGTYNKMCDLQDFILSQENQALVREHEMDSANTTLSAFRDYGLGYDTDIQRTILDTYSKSGIERVVSGDLRPLLDKVRGLGPNDDLAFIFLGIELAAQVCSSEDPPQKLSLLDNNKAFSESFREVPKETTYSDYGGEDYAPASTEHDVVCTVASNPNSHLEDEGELAGIEANIRYLFRGLNKTGYLHRTSKGHLSERALVDAAIALFQHEIPRNVYACATPKPDTSLCVSIVVDESGSMHPRLSDTEYALAIMGNTLWNQRIPFSITGFRDLQGHDALNTKVRYHRTKPVQYDVFKSFDDNWQNVKSRVKNLVAMGQTPMADGLEFAIRALRLRPETHKLLFILTDGMPSPGHENVVKGQIAWCKAHNVHLTAIGIGTEAERVAVLFPNTVQIRRSAELAQALLSNLLSYLQELQTGRSHVDL